MGDFKEQVGGGYQQVKGKIKEETGDLLDNPRMEMTRSWRAKARWKSSEAGFART